MEGDGEPEILTIVTNPSAGAGVWLWSRDGRVRARSAFHGTPNRWLNPVLGSVDLDGDGDQEILIVRTPHISGILEVLNEQEGRLEVAYREALRDFGLTNHRYRDPNIHTSYACPLAEESAFVVIAAEATGRAQGLIVSEDGARVVDGGGRLRLLFGLDQPNLSGVDFELFYTSCGFGL